MGDQALEVRIFVPQLPELADLGIAQARMRRTCAATSVQLQTA
jgi:hypothetical protein